MSNSPGFTLDGGVHRKWSRIHEMSGSEMNVGWPIHSRDLHT